MFSRLTGTYHADAVAGTLHMRYLAELPDDADLITGHAAMLSPILELEVNDVERRIRRVFEKHREEWVAYLQSLGRNSFVRELGSLS